MMGRAEVSSRIRVNESQRIWAVATNNQGESWVTSHDIRVTVGGCLMTSDDNASVALSQPRVAVPRSFSDGQPGEIRTLVTHPMETGLREGPDGSILPRRLVERFEVNVAGDTVLEVHLHTAVSANPYLRFFLAPSESAQAQFVWHEDTGFEVSEQVNLAL
jgi:sulfur-oxidizing protein SoxY